MTHTSKTQNKKIERQLPTGWQWVKLNDVCDGMYRYPSFYGMKHLNSGVPVIRGEHIQADGEISTNWSDYWFISQDVSEKFPRTQLVVGDLVFTVRGTIGKAGIIRESHNKAQLSPNLIRITPKKSFVDSFYLWYYLQYVRGSSNAVKDNAVTIATVKASDLSNLEIPLPLLSEQQRITKCLNEKLFMVDTARKAVEKQHGLLTNLVNSYFRESLQRKTAKMHLSDCMVEVKKGVGETWAQYPVLGATRAGVAPAKEKVGKQPQRYKLVEPGTIFYNPMRIMIGSIAMLDDGDESGITSPDYVVLKGKEGILHPRWFYYWFRSPYGENFIKSLARGAVRERMLFNRLDKGEIELPDWDTQVKIAEKLKEIKVFKQALESQLAEINELPSALLRQAFAGEMST